MLFVNADSSQSKYPNAFLEGGRKLVWFPSPGQTQFNPLIKRMLAASIPGPDSIVKVCLCAHMTRFPRPPSTALAFERTGPCRAISGGTTDPQKSNDICAQL